MRKSISISQKVDLTLTILVAYLANVSIHAHEIPAMIIPAPTSNISREGYLAQPDIGVSNNTSKNNTLYKSPAIGADYSIISPPDLNTTIIPIHTANRSQDAESYSSATQLITSSPQPDTHQTPTSQQQLAAAPSPQSYCTLGDDTYQLGERWNPNLPPFGVQVCVLCECTVRQRKSCYEPKVACRRITNECPIIDSCPDGKKPVTVAGQCCKSCQSTGSVSPLAPQDGNLQVQQQPAYESRAFTRDPQTTTAQLSALTSFKIVYMNERIKEYMILVKNLPACPARDGDSKAPSTASSTTPQPGQMPATPKVLKGGRNDLNGIDTRLAFKSLHDSATNHVDSPKQRQQSPNQQTPGTRRFDHSSDEQQHPNDVQSASYYPGNSNSPRNNPTGGHNNSRQNNSNQSQQQQGDCILGNDTFQVGDMWNPIVPPFGAQVCVRCNCIFRVRKGCYETKLTCRRINRDCPEIDTCPDGNPPINVDGHCCKTCPASLNGDSVATDQTGEQLILQRQIDDTKTLDGIVKNEKVYRDFQAALRSLKVCIKRENVDIYNSNRNTRRSRRSNRSLN